MTHLGATSVADYAKKKFEEKMGKKQTLDEEQVAQGVKDLNRFFHPIYECAPKEDPQIKRTEGEKRSMKTGKVFIEVERWFDARAFAVKHFGVAEVTTKLVDSSERPFPRLQLRWVGTAATGTTDALRMQVRELQHEEQYSAEDGWKNV